MFGQILNATQRFTRFIAEEIIDIIFSKTSFLTKRPFISIFVYLIIWLSWIEIIATTGIMDPMMKFLFESFGTVGGLVCTVWILALPASLIGSMYIIIYFFAIIRMGISLVFTATSASLYGLDLALLIDSVEISVEDGPEKTIFDSRMFSKNEIADARLSRLRKYRPTLLSREA